MEFQSSLLRGIRSIKKQIESWKREVADPKRRIPLGWADLDELVRGPARGEVFMVAASSHVGKSLFATNVIANNPEERIIFFSLEMPEHQVLENLVAQVFEVPADDLEQMMNVERSLPDYVEDLDQRLPFVAVVDDSNLSLEAMSAYLEEYENYYGDRPRMVIIDYLEEIGGGKASGEGWTRVEASASAVKSWAKTEKVGVIVLHQLNRLTKQWEPPVKDSLKGAGYTEADVVIGLWRPGWEPGVPIEMRGQRQGWLAMNVLKNRVRGKMHPGLLYRIDPSKRIVPDNGWGPRVLIPGTAYQGVR